MNNIKRGEIYWISSGINDNYYLSKTLEKSRPAIIISSDIINKHSGSVEVVFLTASPKKDLLTHCSIRTSKSISTALCENICSIQVDQIGDYIGTCTDSELAMVENCVLISLGISQSGQSPIQDNGALNEPVHISIKKDAEMHIELKKEAEMYKEMYNNLLERLLSK